MVPAVGMIRVFVALGLLVGVAAVGEAQLTKIRFASWGGASPETSFIWTGVHKGYFREEGLEIEWVAGQGAADSLKRLITGSANVAWTTSDAIMFAADQGAKVKAVFNLHDNFYHVVYSPDRLKVTSIKDLKGKKIGVTSQASITRYTLMQALAVAGLPQDDLTYVAVGFAPGPPLSSGQIDAAVSWPNLTNAMRAAGLNLQVWETGVDYPTDEIAVTEETYTKNRDLVDRFVRALVKGIRYENANQEEAAQFLPKYFTAPVTPEVARRYIKVTQDWMHYPATKQKGLGYIDINALEPVVAILRKANLIKNPIDLKQYFTNEFQERHGR